MKKGVSAIALVGAGVLLSACSGSDSDGLTESDFSSFLAVPDRGITNFVGTARAADFEEIPGTDRDTTAGFRRSGDATAQMETDGGAIVALSVSGAGSSASIDTRAGATAITPTSFEADGGDTFIAFVDPEAEGFEYQTFGVWATGAESARGTIGVGSFGARTPSWASLPASASYSGGSTGVVFDVDGTGFLTESTVTVTTDFSTATIESSGTMVTNATTGATSPASGIDFSGSGPVSGTGFMASVTGPLVTGDADGQFYGPAAQEVGGTFSLDSPGGIHYGGAYGGRR